MDEFTLTLNSPLTEEQWDMIADYDFEHTDRIWFRTKHGKEVEFVKRKTGRWEGVHIDVANDDKGRSYRFYSCTACGFTAFPAILAMEKKLLNYCPNCGAKMEG